ncbi:MAG TPA: hypothetical protein PKD56_09525 [Chitinophagales bacterium]|nr:hypothetical protein [Chitinophagales bacterium]
MKKVQFIFSFFLLLTIMLAFSSCNKDDNTNPVLKTADFKASVTGDYAQTIDQAIPPGSTTHSVLGSFSSLGGLSLYCAEGTTWSINLLAKTATIISNGTYTIVAPDGFGVYNHTASGSPTGFYAISGSLTITDTESTAPLGKSTDRYVSGNFTGVFTSGDQPPKTVTISGSFEDVYIVHDL